MSTFDDQKAIAHIEKAIREGRNPGAIWSEGQGEINGFINRHSHESFQDEIAKAKIRLNPNNTQDCDVQAYQRRLWKREREYEVEKSLKQSTYSSSNTASSSQVDKEHWNLIIQLILRVEDYQSNSESKKLWLMIAKCYLQNKLYDKGICDKLMATLPIQL
jgi:hypothetical protein